MVEPLFIKDELSGAQVGSTIELAGPEGKHAVSVRRMRVGEAIQLTDGKGKRARGKVTDLGQASLTLEVEDLIQEEAPKRKLVLVQALAKGDRDELAVQAATELGVWEVIPWQATRSISRWEGPKKAKGQERWQQIVLEASKQSLRAFVPKVQEVIDTKALVALVGAFDLVLVLDTSSTEIIGELVLPGSGRIALVVGPEGGITAEELELFTKAGAKLVSLGSNVLRTSTAGPALIAALVLGKL